MLERITVPDDATEFRVPFIDEPETPGAARAWDITFEGNTATCTECYLALQDAAGGVYKPTLSTELESGKVFLFAVYDPNTAELELETAALFRPEGWPETDTALVRVLLYVLKGTGSGWGVDVDMRGAPIVAVYR